jgi:SAM-dependent methyltransferase
MPNSSSKKPHLSNQRTLRRRVARKNEKPVFDKYDLYRQSVQSPETDVDFFKRVYKELRGSTAEVFREDFCGTFLLSKTWVENRPQHKAWAVDIDPEPLEYGRHHYWNKMSLKAQKRLRIFEGNVLSGKLPEADIAAALNFSYFAFKKRSQLRLYFANVVHSLRKKGLFVLDVFGGTQCTDAIEDQQKLKGFTYYWDQENFDPVTNEAFFHIHFKIKGGKKVENVFTYDWRMWTIPEIRDLLEEVGFKKTHVYWEGTTRSGLGDGQFTRTEQGEACLSWVAYIVAEK